MSLYCILTNEAAFEKVDTDDISASYILKPELEASSPLIVTSTLSQQTLSITKPSHLYLIFKTRETSRNWILDDLIIECNARNCEVYSAGARDDKEKYWSTVRGTTVDESSNNLFSIAISTTEYENNIHHIHLKLLSLRPTNESICFIKMLQVRWRMMDDPPEPGTISNDFNQRINKKEDDLASSSTVTDPFLVQRLDSFVDNQMKHNAAVNQSITDITQQIKTLQLTMMIHQQKLLEKFSMIENKINLVINSLPKELHSQERDST